MRFALGLMTALALAPAAQALEETDDSPPATVEEDHDSQNNYEEAAYDTARQLVYALNQLSNQSSRIAEQAQFNGNYYRAQSYRDFASRTRTLAYELNQRVVGPLTRGAIYQARQQLQLLQQHFQYLEWSFRNLGQVPYQFQQNVQRARFLYQQLRQELAYGGGGGPGPWPGDDLIWQCTAVDRGWEEHPQGHSAQGDSYQQAQQRALAICQQAHGQCVIRGCNQRWR